MLKNKLCFSLGGILSQGEIGKDQPVAYSSRTLNECERIYATYKKEVLAIVYSVQHFRPYVCGRNFTLVMDNKPLVWFINSKDLF